MTFVKFAKTMQVLERFITRMEKESIPRQQQAVFLQSIGKEFNMNLTEHNIKELFGFFGHNDYNIINLNKTA